MPDRVEVWRALRMESFPLPATKLERNLPW